MHRRAELVGQTRQRITEAAMRLHTTIGPSEASIAAIAEEAGVTRLTVYRHFSDQEQLFAACMGHWAGLHPGPDAAAWAAIPDLGTRARRALTELYAWYTEVGDDLYPIHRDITWVPAGVRAAMHAGPAAMADVIVGEVALAGAGGRRLRAVAGHLVTLETWRSLVVEQGLTAEEAVELGVAWLLAAGR
jgi:AcrR family transcriptional regulator